MRPCFLLLFLGTAHTSWHSTGAASSCLTPRAPPVPSAPPHGPCPSWWPGVPLALYVAALPCGAVPCRAVPWCGHRVISAVLEPSPAPGCEDVGAGLCPRLPPSSLQRVWGSPSAPRAQPSLGLHPALQQQPKAQGRVPVAHWAHRTHRWSRDRLSTPWSGARLPAAAPTLAEAPGTGRTRGCSRSPHPTGAGQHSHVSRQPWPRWPRWPWS